MALELEVIAYMRFHRDPSRDILAPTATPSIPPRQCLLSLAPQIQTCSCYSAEVTAALLVTAQDHKYTELETRVSLS